jgi:hypothetical protein
MFSLIHSTASPYCLKTTRPFQPDALIDNAHHLARPPLGQAPGAAARDERVDEGAARREQRQHADLAPRLADELLDRRQRPAHRRHGGRAARRQKIRHRGGLHPAPHDQSGAAVQGSAVRRGNQQAHVPGDPREQRLDRDQHDDQGQQQQRHANHLPHGDLLD